MGPRWNLYLCAALYILGCLWFVKMLIGGVSQFMTLPVMGLAALLATMMMVNFRAYWLGFMLGGGLLPFLLPIPILDRISVGFALQMMMAVFLVGERGLRKGESARMAFSFADKMVLLAGVIVVGRLIYDHPGSARMGGSGGLGNALYFSMAFLLYFAARYMAIDRPAYKKIMLCFVLVALLSYLYGLIMSIGSVPLYYSKYEGGMWFLAPFALAWTLATPMGWLRRNILVVLIVLCSLGMALLGPFRSRLYFALASMLAVAWCFRSHWRLLWLLLASGVVAVVVFLSLPQNKIPAAVVRPLSTIMTVDPRMLSAAQEQYMMSSETGWSSGFRKILLDSAMSQIRRHPFVGIGWAFTFEEIMTAVAIGGGMMDALEVAGDYHNLFLTIAVKCGLPSMILLTLGLLLIVGRFVFWIRKQHTQLPRHDLILLASLFGYWCAQMGQALMNGGGANLINILIITAIFSVVPRLQASATAPETVPPVKLPV